VGSRCERGLVGGVRLAIDIRTSSARTTEAGVSGADARWEEESSRSSGEGFLDAWEQQGVSDAEFRLLSTAVRLDRAVQSF
jgi:hypothetical protein